MAVRKTAAKNAVQEETADETQVHEYSIVAPSGRGSVTNFVECLPNAVWMTGMYEDGLYLSVDGKKQTLKQALAIIEKA